MTHQFSALEFTRRLQVVPVSREAVSERLLWSQLNLRYGCSHGVMLGGRGTDSVCAGHLMMPLGDPHLRFAQGALLVLAAIVAFGLGVVASRLTRREELNRGGGHFLGHHDLSLTADVALPNGARDVAAELERRRASGGEVP